jgi:hypothetical protein
VLPPGGPPPLDISIPDGLRRVLALEEKQEDN